MHHLRSLALSLAFASALTTVSFAAPDHGKMANPPENSAENKNPSAEAKAPYPLDTCVVSGDKFGGDMGPAIDYTHKEPGKPDRLVRFCCKGCVRDFKKDPQKYLSKIDEAAAAKNKHGDGHQHTH